MRTRTGLQIFALGLAVSFSVYVPAQGMTWIVDQSNGPGTHFTDVPPAVAAASDGDTLLIRAGRYNAFTTGKALTVLGESYVTILTGGGFPVSFAIQVTGLGAGKTFVVKNLTVEVGGFFRPSGVSLNNNAGRVHLEAVSSRLLPGVIGASAGLRVVNCREVTVAAGRLVAWTGVSASESTVALSSVITQGADSVPRHTQCDPAGPGITLWGSIAYLSRTSARGGYGIKAIFMTCVAQPGVTANGGWLSVTGDRTTTLAAGTLNGVPVPAVRAGTAVVDTTVLLIPTGGAPKVEGSVTWRRVVSLTAAGAPPGGTVTGEIVCPVGDPIGLLVGLPADPLPTPFGQLFVDPSTLVASGLATQGAGEHYAFRVAIPPLAELRGAPLALQAIHFDQARAELTLSNPTVVIID